MLDHIRILLWRSATTKHLFSAPIGENDASATADKNTPVGPLAALMRIKL
jgi:hypothetical protein